MSSKFIPKVVDGNLPEVVDGSMIFDKESRKVYFDFDGNRYETKSGEAYTEGNGIKIVNNNIAIDDTVVAQKTDLEALATKEELSDYVTKADADEKYAEKTALDSLATKAELESYLTKDDAAETYLSKTDAAETYAEKSELDAYAKTTDLVAEKIAYSSSDIENVENQAQFNDAVVQGINNLITQFETKLNDKQAKLPNAAEAGLVLKATDTEGGVEWAEGGSGSGLPDMTDAKNNDGLKIKVTPAVAKFTNALAVGDTKLYINANSSFDLDNLEYNTTIFDSYPARILAKLNISGEKTAIAAVKDLDVYMPEPVSVLIFCTVDSAGEVEDLMMPLYIPKDLVQIDGAWSAGWFCTQTDGYTGMQAKRYFDLVDPDKGIYSFPGTLLSDDLEITDVDPELDLTLNFSGSPALTILEPEKKEAVWADVLPAAVHSNQVLSSDIEEYDLFNLLGTQNAEMARYAELYLNKEATFEHLDELSYDSCDQDTCPLLVNRYTANKYMNRQGLIAYSYTQSGETNYAIFWCCGNSNGANVQNIPLYATAPMEFDYTYYVSQGSSDTETHHYIFTQVGWNPELEEDKIELADDFEYQELLAYYSSDYDSGITSDADRIKQLFTIFGKAITTQKGIFLGDKKVKAASFKSISSSIEELTSVGAYQGHSADNDGKAYAYSSTDSENPIKTLVSLDYGETLKKMVIPAIPEAPRVSSQAKEFGRHDQILVTDEKWDESLGLGRRYKWLAPPTNYGTKVLTYDSCSGICWMPSGSTPSYPTETVYYNYDACTPVFKFGSLAANATYKVIVYNDNYYNHKERLAFTLYTDESGVAYNSTVAFGNIYYGASGNYEHTFKLEYHNPYATDNELTLSVPDKMLVSDPSIPLRAAITRIN